MVNIFRSSSFTKKYYIIPKLGFSSNFGFSRRVSIPSYLLPILLNSHPACDILCSQQNILLSFLKTSCSKNVILPKRPSDQSITLSNHGRVEYSTHGSPTTTSYSKTSWLILIAHDSTTKLMLDQSSMFFESCQVFNDQNSTFLIILWFLKAWLQILTLSILTVLPLQEGYYNGYHVMDPCPPQYHVVGWLAIDDHEFGWHVDPFSVYRESDISCGLLDLSTESYEWGDLTPLVCFLPVPCRDRRTGRWCY